MGEYKRSLLDPFWELQGWKHPRAQILEEEDNLKKKKMIEKNKRASMQDLIPFFPFLFSFLLMVVFHLPFMF